MEAKNLDGKTAKEVAAMNDQQDIIDAMDKFSTKSA